MNRNLKGRLLLSGIALLFSVGCFETSVKADKLPNEYEELDWGYKKELNNRNKEIIDVNDKFSGYLEQQRNISQKDYITLIRDIPYPSGIMVTSYAYGSSTGKNDVDVILESIDKKYDKDGKMPHIVVGNLGNAIKLLNTDKQGSMLNEDSLAEGSYIQIVLNEDDYSKEEFNKEVKVLAQTVANVLNTYGLRPHLMDGEDLYGTVASDYQLTTNYGETLVNSIEPFLKKYNYTMEDFENLVEYYYFREDAGDKKSVIETTDVSMVATNDDITWFKMLELGNVQMKGYMGGRDYSIRITDESWNKFNPTRAGEYYLDLVGWDFQGRKAEGKLKVIVKAPKPVINGFDNEVSLGAIVGFNEACGIYVEDSVDGIQYFEDKEIDTSKEGEIPHTVTYTNSNGEVVTRTFKVTVKKDAHMKAIPIKVRCYSKNKLGEEYDLYTAEVEANVGDVGVLTAPKIDGYKIVGESEKQITFDNKVLEVSFEYAIPEYGGIKVSYVDSDGNKLAPDAYYQDEIGEKYQIDMPTDLENNYTIKGTPKLNGVFDSPWEVIELEFEEKVSNGTITSDSSNPEEGSSNSSSSSSESIESNSSSTSEPSETEESSTVNTSSSSGSVESSTSSSSSTDSTSSISSSSSTASSISSSSSTNDTSSSSGTTNSSSTSSMSNTASGGSTSTEESSSSSSKEDDKLDYGMLNEQITRYNKEFLGKYEQKYLDRLTFYINKAESLLTDKEVSQEEIDKFSKEFKIAMDNVKREKDSETATVEVQDGGINSIEDIKDDVVAPIESTENSGLSKYKEVGDEEPENSIKRAEENEEKEKKSGLPKTGNELSNIPYVVLTMIIGAELIIIRKYGRLE